MSDPDIAGPNHLRPCIAELLRTRHLPSSLVLRIDKIVVDRSLKENVEDGGGGGVQQCGGDLDRHAFRLLLTDGELSIQAVINRDLHHLLRERITGEGQLIYLRRCSIQRAQRLNGSGQVVFLAVEEYSHVGTRAVALYPEQTVQPLSPSKALKRSLGSSLEDQLSMHGRKNPKRVARDAALHRPGRKPANPSTKDDSDSDGFETLTVPSTAALHHRHALRAISGNHKLQWSRNHLKLNVDDPVEPNLTTTGSTDRTPPSPSAAQPNNIAEHGPSKPSPPPVAQSPNPSSFPLHTLSTLLDLSSSSSSSSPLRNYKCRILAVITWISPSILKRPGLPPKRHIKVHDATISSHRYASGGGGVTISIFVDAAHFRPAVGTIALFSGVTAQTWAEGGGEVILNAYAKDCGAGAGPAGEGWYVDDVERLRAEGFAVDELQRWWKEWSGKGKMNGG